MFLIRQLLLQIIVPLTVLAVVVLIVLQLVHLTLFNADWYKNSIRDSGAYEQLAAASRLPDWLQNWLGGNTPQQVVQQQVESTIDSTLAFVKGNDEITVPSTVAPVVTDEQEKDYVRSVGTIRTLYRATRTALVTLYVAVPVLLLVMIWLLIKEMISFLKMLWNILIGTSVVLLLTGGLGTVFKDNIIESMIPDQWEAMTNIDIVIRVLGQLVQAVMQVLLIAGAVSVILSLVVWFILRSMQSKPSRPEKEVMAPPLTDDSGVPPTMASATGESSSQKQSSTEA